MPIVRPHAAGHQPVEERQHRRDTIDHCSIDDLAFTRFPCLENGGKQTHGEVQSPASEVGDQVQGNGRRAPALTDTAKRTTERYVIGVMSCGRCKRSSLAPARNATKNDAPIACRAVGGPQSELLHDAGPKALEYRVRLFAETKHQFDAFVGF